VEVLVQEDHAVRLVTYHEGEDVSLPGMVVHRTPRLPGIRGIKPGMSWKKLAYDFMLTVTVLRLLRTRDIDVVHGVEEGAFIGLLGKWFFGIPFVYDMDSALTPQATEQWRILRPFKGLMSRLECLPIRESLYVVAVCELLGERARELVPEASIILVEDFSMLPPSTASPSERLAETIGDDRPIILYVGNLEPYQGIDLLLSGFREAVKARPDMNLVVIGGRTKTIDHYRSVSSQLGIASRVHFLGPRPQERLGEYLEQADVVVSPRIQGINTPMKVYSYLDSGRPLLATRLPTHTQVLDDDIACLFEPDSQALAQALTTLMEDPELRLQLARRAKDRVESEFSRAAFARKVRSLYQLVERDVRKTRSTADQA
jgi:glycosyltransferase involved in cell wall biosynthesis